MSELVGGCIVVTRRMTAAAERAVRGSTRDEPCWIAHRLQVTWLVVTEIRSESFGLVTEHRTTTACYVSSLICLPIRCPRSLQRTSYFSSSSVVSRAFSALCAGCLKTDIWINTAKFTIWTNIKILNIVKFGQSWFGQRNKNWHNQTKHSYLLDVDFSVIIRPPDICIGRLRFYRDSIFYLLFARYSRSSLNRTQLTPATCSEVCAIGKRMSLPFKSGAQNTYFWQLHNLAANLTAYIFGMKHDIDNR